MINIANFACYSALEIDLEEMALQHRPSTSTAHPTSNANDLQRRVAELEQALQAAQVQALTRQEAIDKMFKEKFGSVESAPGESIDASNSEDKDKGKSKEDAGYFHSYSGNRELTSFFFFFR